MRKTYKSCLNCSFFLPLINSFTLIAQIKNKLPYLYIYPHQQSSFVEDFTSLTSQNVYNMKATGALLVFAALSSGIQALGINCRGSATCSDTNAAGIRALAQVMQDSINAGNGGQTFQSGGEFLIVYTPLPFFKWIPTLNRSYCLPRY